jgi:hypothetical protein
MKNKKFKLERSVLTEVDEIIRIMLLRVRTILPDINVNHEQCFNTVTLYYTSLLNYLNEVQKLLESKSSSILISKEEFTKLNNMKNLISILEKEIDYYPFISLKMH